jgi:hypothetical protein
MCLWLLVGVAALSVGCGSNSTEVVDRTVKVGCGMCQFGMPHPGGCYWAVEIDGKVVPARGQALPSDHDNHAPDGMCNVTRDAVVSGTLYETYFLATRFDLQPVEAPEHPQFGPDDVH